MAHRICAALAVGALAAAARARQRRLVIRAVAARGVAGVTKAAALIRRAPSADADLDAYADRITQALNKTVEGIFETGRQLLAARTKLEHGLWERLFEERRVPISLRTAQRFIEIHKRREVLVAKATHVSLLPASWGTLYELARLPDDTLAWAHAHDKITPDLERKQIAKLKAEYEGVPLPPARQGYRLDNFGVRTPGSRLLTQIERRLTHAFDQLSTDDRVYVITMLRQILDALGTTAPAPSSTE